MAGGDPVEVDHLPDDEAEGEDVAEDVQQHDGQVDVDTVPRLHHSQSQPSTGSRDPLPSSGWSPGRGRACCRAAGCWRGRSCRRGSGTAGGGW